MANTVIALKKSGTSSATPGSLADGELAINYADGKLFYKSANGSILSISGTRSNTFSTVNANGTLVVSDSPSSILTIIPSDGITVTGDAINDKITIGMNIPNVNATSQTFTGNGSNTIFNLSSTVSNARNVIVTVNGLIQIPTTHYSLSGNTITFTDAPVANSSIEARVLEGVVISGGGSGGGSSYTRTTITATAGQTSFSATYTVNYVQVYVNGILLNDTDYTATTGTTVVLTLAAAVGDIVDVVALNIGSFTGGVTITGTPASGQLTAWTGATSIQGFAPSTTGDVPFSTNGTTFTSTPKIVRGTAVASTSGTSIDFTSIPSWVKRITFMLQGVSTNGTSVIELRIGSGSITATGYSGSYVYTVNITATGGSSSTTGFQVPGVAAGNIRNGIYTLINLSGNIWVASGCGAFSEVAGSWQGGGNVTLSGTLDRVRLTTVNGTDTFDAGSVNILYE